MPIRKAPRARSNPAALSSKAGIAARQRSKRPGGAVIAPPAPTGSESVAPSGTQISSVQASHWASRLSVTGCATDAFGGTAMSTRTA
jgi:hypothetical protein